MVQRSMLVYIICRIINLSPSADIAAYDSGTYSDGVEQFRRAVLKVWEGWVVTIFA